MDTLEIAKKLYGDCAEKEITNNISELSSKSNFKFDSKYIEIGIQFLGLKLVDEYSLKLGAEKIGSEFKPKELRSLVSSAFGEAAIYKFNVCGR